MADAIGPIRGAGDRLASRREGDGDVTPSAEGSPAFFQCPNVGHRRAVLPRGEGPGFIAYLEDGGPALTQDSPGAASFPRFGGGRT